VGNSWLRVVEKGPVQEEAGAGQMRQIWTVPDGCKRRWGGGRGKGGTVGTEMRPEQGMYQ